MAPEASFHALLREMTGKGLGFAAVVDAQRRPAGIFTDGDLRRALARVGDIRHAALAELMTREPRSIGPDALAAEAAQIMEQHRINQLLVLDADGTLAGALNMHDLMQAKVI